MIRSSVKPGDRKILADEYNLFLRNSRRPQGVPGGTLEEMYPPTICYVRNDTAFTCDAFTVLGLDGPVITRADNDVEFRNSITFKGVTPDSDEHTGKYCILQEPIKSGEIGRAVMSGVSWCQLNITADTDTAAEIEDGTRSYLKTGGSGSAKILYMESGTGTNKWGVVYLYNSTTTTGVPFRNDSGETVPAYAVMKVVDQVDIGGAQYLTINKPDYTFQRRYLINTGTAVANTETGFGDWLDESALVLYDESEGDPNGEEWGAWPGQWTLKKERLGFTLFKKSAAGIALGSQREIVSVFGKFYEELEQGGSADFKVWMRYDGQKRDTQMILTAYDWYLNKDETIARNTQGELAWYSNKWHVRNAYCSEDDTDDAAGGSMASMGADGSGFPQVFVSVSSSGGYISPSVFQGFDL